MPEPSTRPGVEYLLIGHVTRDLTPEGSILGGTAAYAGLTAHALGWRVGVVSSASTKLDVSQLASLQLSLVPASEDTTFENIYVGGKRSQWLRGRAADLTFDDVPVGWRQPRVVHLAPLAQEIDPALAHAFPDAMVAVTPQGWLRRWDKSGRVHRSEWESMEAVLSRADATVLSLEDLHRDEALVTTLVERSRLLIVTEGPRGARLYHQRSIQHIPAYPAEEVDPTGAGDVFAAAFFTRFAETADALSSATFAARQASASVSGVGLAALGRLPVATSVGSKGR